MTTHGLLFKSSGEIRLCCGMSDSLLIDAVVHDDLLFVFPRIDNRARVAACSSSWGMQIPSWFGLQFLPGSELVRGWSIDHKHEIGIVCVCHGSANPLRTSTLREWRLSPVRNCVGDNVHTAGSKSCFDKRLQLWLGRSSAP